MCGSGLAITNAPVSNRYNVPVFGTQNYCHFEVILAGDGSVLLQYLDMPVSGSHSQLCAA